MKTLLRISFMVLALMGFASPAYGEETGLEQGVVSEIYDETGQASAASDVLTDEPSSGLEAGDSSENDFEGVQDEHTNLILHVENYLDMHGVTGLISLSYDGDGGLTSLFETQPAEATVAFLKERGVSISVLTPKEPELLVILQELERRAMSVFVGVTDLSLGLNVEHGRGKVVVTATAEGVELLTKSLGDDPNFDKIEFEIVSSFGGGIDQVWSGGGSFQGECTGAFPAERGSEVGILTAAHCFENQNVSPIAYEGNIIQSIHTPSAVIDDIAFIGLLGVTSGKTRTAGSTYEFMSWFRNPLLGESVCHFGITTGKACSTIRSKFTNGTLNGEPVKNVAVVQSSVSAPGDSGGPWFTNTTAKIAVGVHKGSVWLEGAWRSVFTMISSISLVGATLITPGLQ